MQYGTCRFGTLRIIGKSYAYDPSGNRASETRDGVSINYTYNSANQITSRVNSAEAISYSYDSNGNLTTETSTLSGAKSYSYDYEDRLLSVIPAQAGIQSAYTYSGDGRRTSSNAGGNVVKYIYDGMTPLIERDASDATKVVYTKNPLSIGGIGGLISSIQPALPAAGHIPDVALGRGRVLNVIFNTYYYHDSNLGNVNQITDSTGAVVQTYDYDSFGNIVNQTGSLTTKYAYKTKEYSPETGLVFFGARYYNPLIGRFITEDPLGQVDGPNQYIYCWNDPINKIDTYGNLTIGSEEGNFMIRMFKNMGGEPFRMQWQYGGQLHHIADSIKYGFHYANETMHYYWNRAVILQDGKWIVVSYPLAGKIAGSLTGGGLVVGAGYVGWGLGNWISKLPIPNLVDNCKWGVTFGNAFVPW